MRFDSLPWDVNCHIGECSIVKVRPRIEQGVRALVRFDFTILDFLGVAPTIVVHRVCECESNWMKLTTGLCTLHICRASNQSTALACSMLCYHIAGACHVCLELGKMFLQRWPPLRHRLMLLSIGRAHMATTQRPSKRYGRSTV